MRLRERVGGYYKYMDNTLINNPDPRSNHYMKGMVFYYKVTLDVDRYDKDYASHDKRQRDEKSLVRKSLIEQKR